MNEDDGYRRPPAWPVWQVLVLIGVSVLALFYIGARFNESRSVAASVPTPAWPTLAAVAQAATATPTPEPAATSTPTPTVTATATATPTPTPTPIVAITAINRLGRLETAQYLMQTVIDVQNESEGVWDRVFGAEQLLLVAEGGVIAGFDLALVQEEDVTVDGRQVHLLLPPPQVLVTYVDNARTSVYSRSRRLFLPVNTDLETEARRLAEERLESWALERGILNEARESGIREMDAFLRKLGFDDIRIDVREGE